MMLEYGVATFGELNVQTDNILAAPLHIWKSAAIWDIYIHVEHSCILRTWWLLKPVSESPGMAGLNWIFSQQ